MTTVPIRRGPKPVINGHHDHALLLDNLAKTYKIQQPHDWYKISHNQIKQLKEGKELLRKYNGSLSRALVDICPQVDWKMWKFQSNNVPAHFWDDTNNQKNFFDDLAQELNLQNMEQWYSIKLDDIERYGGGGLIHKYYGGSIVKALSQVYPERNWIPWKFRYTPQAFWENKQNQKLFFDWLESTLGLTNWEDWYQIKMSDVYNVIGSSDLFSRYDYSLIKALSHVYPEHSWEVWKFEKVPKGFWKDLANVRKYFDWLGSQLGIVHITDWLYVTPETVPRMLNVIREHGGFIRLLKRLYPEFSWESHTVLDASSTASTSKTLLKSQKLLTHLVQQLFPNADIFTDYKHPRLIYSHTNRHMQFDIFLPELQLAFEYQGQQHYYWNYLRGDQSTQQTLDEEKKKACKSSGITLIEVPFWWDRSRNSVLGTLLKAKPDIAPYLSGALPSLECLRPIPEAPNKKVSDSIAHRGQKHQRYVPQWMPWKEEADPTSWWVSAVVPGIRILFDGKNLATPSGQTLNFPDTVTSKIMNQLPKIQLDLILSVDNDLLLQQLQQVISSHADISMPINLSVIDFGSSNMVFTLLDSPTEISLFFEQRMNTILDMIPHKIPQMDDLGIQSLLKPTEQVSLNIADGVQIQDRNHFKELVQRAKQNNVKGLLLRKNTANYAADIGWQYYQLDQISVPLVSSTRSRYVLSKGSNRGKPKCRGCSKEIPSQQPRILVSGSFTPLSSYPFAATYQICLDMACLDKAVTKYATNKEVGIGATLPPFGSMIAVEKQLTDMIPELEREHKEIKWFGIQ